MKLSVCRAGFGKQLSRCSGNIYVYLYDCADTIAPGDLVEIQGTVVKPCGPRNPGEPDYRKIFRLRNIAGSVFLRNKQVILLKKRITPSLIFRIRAYLKTKIDSSYSTDISPLINSLILGIRTNISAEQWASFRGSGTVHILAISGLHMSLLIGMAYFVLTLIRMSPKLKYILLIGITLFYMLISGANIPVVRTSVMLIVYLMSRIICRKTYVYNTLAAAAFIILLFDPAQLFSPGFILSFTAILSLLHLTPLVTRCITAEKTGVEQMIETAHPVRYAIKHTAMKALLLSAAAWLGTFPITIRYFGILTPYSIAANFLFVPVVALILISGFIFILIAPLCCAAVLPFALIGSFFGRILMHGISGVKEFPLSVLHIDHFPMVLYYSCVLVLIAVFRLYSPVSRTRLRAGALSLVQIILIYPVILSLFTPAVPELHILDVGHGDCAVIRHSGAAVMVDTGSAVKKKTVRSVLDELGIRRIDLLVLSHFDEDHSGNAGWLIGKYSVRNLIMPTPSLSEKGVCTYIRSRAEAHGCRLLSTSDSGTVKTGSVLTEIFHVRIPLSLSPNDRSLVCRISAGSRSIFFTGDIERYGTAALLSSHSRISADILKAPHHGRAETCLKQLIRAADPCMVFIPQGKRDLKPSQKTRSLLAESKIPFLSTAETGHIRITLTPDMKVETFLKQRKNLK